VSPPTGRPDPLTVASGAGRFSGIAAPGQDGPPPLSGGGWGGGIYTGFRTALTGAHPVSYGHVFAPGDVPGDLTTDHPRSQITITNRWPDGSVCHAHIAADSVDFVANVATRIRLLRGTPAGGTTMTAAQITAAAPVASITISDQGGTLGVVQLADLLAAGPVQTRNAGPRFIEAVYRAPNIAHSTGAYTPEFIVYQWQSGRYAVRPFVSKGYLDGPIQLRGQASGHLITLTFRVNNIIVVQRTATMFAQQMAMGFGWGPGGDPAVVPEFDVAYLRGTPFSPPYDASYQPSLAGRTIGKQGPYHTEYVPLRVGDLSPQNATPQNAIGNLGDMRAVLGTAGYSDHIGILPRWTANWLHSGDPGLYKTMLANTSYLATLPIHYRSVSTNELIRPSAYPDWTDGGQGQGALGNGGVQVLVDDDGLGFPIAMRWTPSHRPESAMAYAMTGDWWYYKIMAADPVAMYVCKGGVGLGTNRDLQYQVRGNGWTERSFMQYSRLADAGDTLAVDARLLLKTLRGVQNAYRATPGHPQYGYLFPSVTYPPLDLGISVFMTNFWQQALGYSSRLLGANADAAADLEHRSLRDWMYQFVVGILGDRRIDPTAWHYTYSGMYNAVGWSVSEQRILNNLNEVFLETYAQYPDRFNNQPITLDDTLRNAVGGGGPEFAYENSYGDMRGAIAYAVDDGAPGALEAYQRLISADNHAVIEAIPWGDWGQFNIKPRYAAVPAWLQGVGLRQWVSIPNTQSPTIPVPTPRYGHAAYNGPGAIQDAWCGWAFDARTNSIYAAAAGGHGDKAQNEIAVICLDDDVPAWRILHAGDPESYIDPDTNQLVYTWYVPTPGNIINDNSTGRNKNNKGPTKGVLACHDYYNPVVVGDNIIKIGLGAVASQGTTLPFVEGFNLTANAWADPGTWPQMPFFPANAATYSVAKHPVSEQVYVCYYNDKMYRRDVNGSWATLENMGAGLGYTQIVEGTASAIDPTRGTLGAQPRGVVLCLGGGAGGNTAFTYDINGSGNKYAAVTLTGPAAAKCGGSSALGLVFVPGIDRYVVRRGENGGGLYTINPNGWVCEQLATTGGGEIVITIPQHIDQVTGLWYEGMRPWGKFFHAKKGVVYFPRFGLNAQFCLLHE
jgi:hypothetical protein